ncbi:MAG: efflux RND transporter permease subunit [Fusobacteria bacterium]|nr:efflux RND transporter permease subunit [Fusobacteriota bacterium]
MFLTKFSLKKTRIIVWVMVVIMLAGTIGYIMMPKAEDPTFSVGTAVIVTYYPGATAAQVENRITAPIEKQLQNLPGLWYTNSTSQDGMSTVYVNVLAQYSEGATLQEEWTWMRRYMEMLEQSNGLPKGIIGPVINDFFGDVYGSVYALTGEGYNNGDLKTQADQITRELGMIPGVGKVQNQGELQKTIYIKFDMDKMANLKLNPYLIAQILTTENVVVPSGILYIGGNQINLNPSGDYATVDQIRNTVIGIPGQSQTIELKDIADVEETYQDPPTTATYYNGQPAMLFSISLAPGGNILNLGKNLTSYFNTKALPQGMQFHQVFFEATTTKESISAFLENLIEAIVIVCASVIIFVGIGGGVLIASIIPLTIFATFAFMSILGVTINQVSLSALMIALGILVDNGIVVVEGAIVKVEEGMDKKTAILESVNEVWVPLIVSTLCLSATFLPIFLSPTSAGQYTADLFIVITLTLVCSWFIATTCIPVLFVKYFNEKKLLEPKKKRFGKKKKTNEATQVVKVETSLKEHKGEDLYNTPFYKKYRAFNYKLLSHPWRVVGVFVLALVIVLPFWKYIPQVFFPYADNATIIFKVQLENNASVYGTNDVIEGLNKYISDNLKQSSKRPNGVTNWTSFVGSDAPRFTLTYSPTSNSSNEATVIINLANTKNMDKVMGDLRQYGAQEIPGGQITIERLTLGPPADHDVEIRLLGENKEALKAASIQLQSVMANIPGAVDVGDNWGNPTPQFNINLNQDKLRDLGISSQDVGYSLQMNYGGLPITDYYITEQTVPIALRGLKTGSEVNTLDTTMLYSSTQNTYVPLNQVATIDTSFVYEQIQHYSGFDCVTAYANASGNVTPTDILNKVLVAVHANEAEWKSQGIFWQIGGDQQNSSQSSGSIAAGMPITIFIIFTLLMVKFNSFRKPITLFLILPFSIIGVIIGFLITGQSFGFMPMLGVLSLVGIILNHAIVLIDRIDIELHHNGGDHNAALVESIVRRTRPVTITVLTAILGMIPLWIGGGQLFAGMAVAIIFGLLFEMLYIVILAPAIYTILYNLNYKKYLKAKKLEERN